MKKLLQIVSKVINIVDKRKEVAFYLLIICLATYLYFLLKKQEKIENNNSTLVQLINRQQDTIVQYQDKYNRTIGEKQAIVGTVQALKEGSRLGEQLIKENIKLKRLLSYSYVGLTIHDTIHATLIDTIVQLDSLSKEYKIFEYNDSTLSMKGKINEQEIDVFYQMNLKINTYVHWKRKWFLGKKKYHSKVIANNPNVIFNNIETIVVKD